MGKEKGEGGGGYKICTERGKERKRERERGAIERKLW